MLGVVVQIEGWDPVAGAPVSLRAASHDVPEICHLAVQGVPLWWPVLTKLPTLRYDLFDGAFAGGITTPASSLTMRTEPWPEFGRYALADARLRLWTGEIGDAWAAWTLRFDGRVSAQPKLRDGAADIDFAVDDRWLDAALLPTYAGTTGAEGAADLKGQAKPLAIGAPRYVPGTLVDSITSVFQVSAFAINGVEAALERAARYGAAQGDFADYAALVAAQLPAGTWATAKAFGLVRFGAPPSGKVSFLVRGDAAGAGGWVRTPGAVIRRVAELAGGAGKIDGTSLTALDAARPFGVSLYLEQQTTARQVIQDLAASLNCVAGVSWTGQLFVVPVAIGAASLTLAADGSALPMVKSVERIETSAPWRRLAIGAERTWSVHPLSDIAFTAPLVEVGSYAAATVYREGNIVSLPDGSRWIYTSPASGAGQAPAAGSAIWGAFSAAPVVSWEAITDSQGTKPEDNATAGDNIVRNGSLLDGASGWTAGGGNTTLTLGGAADPGNFFRVTGADGVETADPANLPAGAKTIFVSYWKRSSEANRQIAFDINWLKADGSARGQTRVNSFVGAAGAWFFYQTEIAVPTDAVAASYTAVITCAAGGYHDFGQLRVAATQQAATQGATWSSNLAGRPSNIAALAGGENINNAGLSIGSNGALAGGGGGQVTITGLGYLGDLTATYGASWGITLSGRPSNIAALGGGESINNAALSIGANGVLAGGGGGQVTISGLGYSGALNATYGASWSLTLTGRPANIAALGGGEGINNGLLSIGANGALAGGGGGQVTITGLGYNGDLGATRGDNAIRNGGLTEGTAGWTPTSGNPTLTLAGNADPGNYYRTTTNDGSIATAVATLPAGASTLFVSYWKRSTEGGRQIAIDYTWLKPDGTTLTAGRINRFVGIAGQWFFDQFEMPRPDGATGVTFNIVLTNSANTYHDFGQFRVSATQQAATLGATWGGNLAGRPSNLLVLVGTEGINNGLLSIGANGALAGGGGGQVTISGLGFTGDLNAGVVLTLYNPGGSQTTFKGTTVTRVTGNGWSTTGDEVHSRESFPSCAAVGMFVQGGAEEIFGLSDGVHAPNAQSYQRADFCWYRDPNGNVQPLAHDNNGAQSAPGPLEPVDYTAVYAVLNDRVTISWLKNDVVKRQVPAPYQDGRPYHLIAMGNGAGSSVASLRLLPYTSETGKQKLDPYTGRIADPTAYNTQGIIGASSTTNLTPSYSVGASNVTVNLPAHTRYIAGINGPIALNYGAGSGAVGFGSYWVAFIDDPSLTGIGSPTIGFSSDPNVLLYPGRYQVASGVAPASGGTGGSVGSGGGYSGGVDGCVCAGSFMPAGGLAADVAPGDALRVLNEASWDGAEWTVCQANRIQPSECVRLTSASGVTLVVSVSTPCTLRGGAVVLAPDVLGLALAVEDEAGFRWEEIVGVEPLGERPVAHISANDGTYGAGERPGRYLYTHNIRWKP